MKILPPITEWLPALLRTFGARFALAASLIIIAAAMVPLFARLGRDRPPPPTAATLSLTTNCSELVHDRTAGATLVDDCRPAVTFAPGRDLTAGRALERGDMSESQNRLTAADRAIKPPASLRTSVWEVGIARDDSRPDDTPSDTASTTNR